MASILMYVSLCYSLRSTAGYAHSRLQLLSLVSQPVKAFILCFPITESLQKAEDEADERITKEGQHRIDPTIMFIKQTVCPVLR